jgi:hypothetical protein
MSVLAAGLAAVGSIWQARITKQALETTREQITLSRRQYEKQINRARLESERQASVTEQQVRLTRESAEATKANALASLSSARAAEEATNFAKTSFQTSHRAYMVMESSTLDSQPAAGQSLAVSMRFKNVGQTPALRVNAGWECYFLSVEKVVALKEPPPVQFGNESIGPNLQFDAKYKWEITPEQMSALVEGRSILVLHSAVVYKDIFGNVHRTEACSSWNKNIPSLTFGFCHAGLLDEPRFQ